MTIENKNSNNNTINDDSINAVSDNIDKFKKACDLLKDDRPNVAFKLFELSADNGFAPSKLALGIMYGLGIAVGKDLKKAEQYLSEAAGQGGGQTRLRALDFMASLLKPSNSYSFFDLPRLNRQDSHSSIPPLTKDDLFLNAEDFVSQKQIDKRIENVCRYLQDLENDQEKVCAHCCAVM